MIHFVIYIAVVVTFLMIREAIRMSSNTDPLAAATAALQTATLQENAQATALAALIKQVTILMNQPTPTGQVLVNKAELNTMLTNLNALTAVQAGNLQTVATEESELPNILTAWLADTALVLGDQFVDPNGNLQVVTGAGTTGDTEPTFSTVVPTTTSPGGTTTDGPPSASPTLTPVTWTNQGTSPSPTTGSTGPIAAAKPAAPSAAQARAKG